jgi:hypothetical protein
VRKIFLLEKKNPCILTSRFCTTFVFILVVTKNFEVFVCLGVFFSLMKLLSFLQIWIQTLQVEVQATSSLFILGFFPEIVVNFANVDPNLRA